MNERDILVPTAVLAVLRREESVRGVADRFGVTEAEVLEWQDVFLVAGILALTEHRTGRLRATAERIFTTIPSGGTGPI